MSEVITGIFTLLGVALGLFGERLVRRIGEVRCEIDSWWLQQGDAIGAEERRLQVTFLNGKEVPLTIMDMRVVFYRDGQLLEDWTRPSLSLIDDHGGVSPIGAVNLYPHIAVPLTISVIAGRDDIRRELAKAVRAEFVARIVGARDQVLPLDPLGSCRPALFHPPSESR